MYNLLDKFLAQLETKYNEDIISFEHFEHKKISLVKSNLAASVKRY